jgi:hypothetical protein
MDDLQPALLFAAFADHLHICDCHVIMLSGILIHAVLFRLGLRIFLHTVHFGIRNRARNRNRMADMSAQLVAVALELPSAAFAVVSLYSLASSPFCRQPVSVRVLLWVVLVVSCAVARPAVPANRNNTKDAIAIFTFTVLPPKFGLEKWESRPSPPRIG